MKTLSSAEASDGRLALCKCLPILRRHFLSPLSLSIVILDLVTSWID